MVNQYRKHASDSHWSYSWTLGDNPVVSFCNSKVRTNVIYTLDELQSVLKCTDEEISFIPLPRRIMENALSIVDGSLTRAA